MGSPLYNRDHSILLFTVDYYYDIRFGGRMRIRPFLIGTAFAMLIGVAGAVAQDAENCKDHPMFSRMKSFYIDECTSSFDAVEFYTPDGNKTVEGQKTEISYALIEGNQMPSPLQIRRNYGTAIKSLGGTIIYDRDEQITAKATTKAGKVVWLRGDVTNDGGSYKLWVVEVEAMVQEVSANDMLDALNKDGHIALYINFDTGKADIKPESLPTVEQITALLKSNPDLMVKIEGHTDNVGTPQSNKLLSEQRAKAVMAAVLKGGIAADRISSLGWGQEKPASDNRTEDGRAKNRRVEIVKK
jgi:OmpA-OmpF porin, OOP family